MSKNKIMKLIASAIMFISGIMMLMFQFNDNKRYMLIASVGIAIFGLVLIIANFMGKKDNK